MNNNCNMTNTGSSGSTSCCSAPSSAGIPDIAPIHLIRRIESRERCAESGWYAYDFLLSEPMTATFIQGLRAFGGSFVFLPMLKKPFFKLESDNYILKGIQGDTFFRMAVQEDHTAELDRAETFLKNPL